MQAWADDQKVHGSIVSFLADPNANVVDAFDVELVHEGFAFVPFSSPLQTAHNHLICPRLTCMFSSFVTGPTFKMGPKRSKRFAAYIDDGEIKAFKISEGEDDPAGDDDPSGTCVDEMLKTIDAVNGKEL